MDLIYTNQPGKPLKDRETTIRVMEALTGGAVSAVEERATSSITDEKDDPLKSMTQPPPRPPLSNVYGHNQPLILSDIPESCYSNTGGGIVLGVDEAGRGPVIGPMVYGMSFWHTSVQDRISKDFGDSKKLTDPQREALFATILKTPEMGFCTRVLHASEISRKMFRQPESCNLNQMSHDACIQMIRCLTDLHLPVSTCYIDTVGNPAAYKRRLEQEFPGVEFVVESKADDKYAPCSAASIVAKVVRDRMLANWKFSEPALADTVSTKFGSGYPGDETCKAWMKNNLSDPIFGWPDVVRFSWGPAKKQLAAEATAVTFAADDHDEDDEDDAQKHKILLGKKRQQEAMKSFLSTGKTKQKRLPYFERRRLQVVTKL